jgi:hypothetical protein
MRDDVAKSFTGPTISNGDEGRAGLVGLVGHEGIKYAIGLLVCLDGEIRPHARIVRPVHHLRGQTMMLRK